MDQDYAGDLRDCFVRSILPANDVLERPSVVSSNERYEQLMRRYYDESTYSNILDDLDYGVTPENKLLVSHSFTESVSPKTLSEIAHQLGRLTLRPVRIVRHSSESFHDRLAAPFHVRWTYAEEFVPKKTTSFVGLQVPFQSNPDAHNYRTDSFLAECKQILSEAVTPGFTRIPRGSALPKLPNLDLDELETVFSRAGAESALSKIQIRRPSSDHVVLSHPLPCEASQNEFDRIVAFLHTHLGQKGLVVHHHDPHGVP